MANAFEKRRHVRSIYSRSCGSFCDDFVVSEVCESSESCMQSIFSSGAMIATGYIDNALPCQAAQPVSSFSPVAPF